eukprot:TRINITY_DN862_c0_g1::TRINITY_DN862_c0_g1_i1::g.25296::m.25296 TRINITY_DN862_c0_g1::TRINITY_DN862_c0_g1_i1::g.25296  ORF type:complete len:257 (-),score=47.70,sp/P47758/SRPRB_MOUSE/32.38/3e-28,SRPRB/PF09439.5/3.8e-35,Arf/PF00025.16/8.7e-12,Miro/PF08477.8/8.5e-08,GTP_EFTU/PF00009.22/6.7e-06,MMR_HSR1/PF01926.18/4.2e-06,ATP_bind_1/PF03029.12/1.4e+03,ATP_bind_1/PF03029.12/0.0036,Arch_ATPase/PF01637.13/0.042,G-alpha/PF00503.15/11,G-alpha/PF00503.15/2.9,vATP-synt_E/PF01991.13/0.12,DUF258/PF03193.11/0.2
MSEGNVTLFPIIAAVLVVLISIFIISKLRSHRQSTKKDTVFILGPSSAGKTALFIQLKLGENRETQASMKENEDVFVISDKFLEDDMKPTRFVDFPGHPRLRSKLYPQLKRASCVIFVVDSFEVNSNPQPAASFLFELFTEGTLASQETPVLVVCNKADHPLAAKMDTIKTKLEKELEKLRVSRSAMPDAIGEENKNYVPLGYEGESFEFSHAPCPVEFASASVYQNKLDSVVGYILQR